VIDLKDEGGGQVSKTFEDWHCFLMPDEARRIIRIAGEGVEGLLETIDRLNSDIQEYAELR
jgi:hypothetical protein